MVSVTIYNEFIHEREDESVKAVYPKGIHETLKEELEDGNIKIRTVTLDNIDEGLSEDVLNDTDVLIWWGHIAHDNVPDKTAVRVQQAVLKGMGIIFLHSAHASKPLKLLTGTSCDLSWREDGDFERIWVVNPSHPIANGIDRYIEIPHDETYSEPFMIPEPDELVFIGSFEGGEIFRSGFCYKRGHGHIFYFQPGHETNPIYKMPDVIKVIRNAIYWARPSYRVDKLGCPNVPKVPDVKR